MDFGTERMRIDRRFDELWPINRSITGPGLRKSLRILQKDIPLEIESIPSGTSVFDWTIPPEWKINEAWLEGPDGRRYADLDDNNLSIVNYSVAIDRHLRLEELDPHLYTIESQPEAIPYVTSYYERNWGFSLPHSVYESLPKGEYHAYIDAEFDSGGALNYGHTVLEGETDYEILLSTYLCHPSLANNELSGPLVMTSLYNWLAEREDRKFTYRFVVVPETIGSLGYLYRYGDHLQKKVVGGFVLTCLGGPDTDLSYKRSRRGNALIDMVVEYLDDYSDIGFRFRPFDTQGSDERQYCSPGFNLPVGQFARTVYADYPEYHTSLDDKSFMTIDALIQSAESLKKVIEVIEVGGYYSNTEPFGEPMMSKRDLYPTVNEPENHDQRELIQEMMRVLNFSDGTRPTIEIAEKFDMSVRDLRLAINALTSADLLRPAPQLPAYEIQYSDHD